MEFNQLKRTRTSRNQKPLYAIKAAFNPIVQRQNEEGNRCSGRCFAGEITVGVVCGGLVLVCTGVLSFGDLALAWLATAENRRVGGGRHREKATLGISESYLEINASRHISRT